MKNNVKIFIPFLLAVIIGSLTFVFAQPQSNGSGNTRPARGEGFGPPHGGGFRGGLPPHVLEQLNLTDAQKQQIQTLEANAREASQGYFDKVRAADEQLRALVESGSFNEEQARQILSAKAQATTELELVRLRTDAAIFNLLTTEQKAQLAQLKANHPPMPPPDGFRPN